MAFKILLDTDIGSDIDDSVCLAYLLAQPQCELLGITTVTGQSLERAMMADAMCRAAGAVVPVYPGIEKPLLVPSHQPGAQQFTHLGDWPHRKDFIRGEAIEFLRRTIRQNPHEVVLLSIGPLTNIATLFAVYPEIPSLLKSMVLMGGNFAPINWHGVAEWNMLNDPHAAAMVFQAPVSLRAVGMDITTRVTMEPDEVKSRFHHPRFRQVMDFAKVWFQGEQKRFTFHDHLAAAVIFKPDLCRFVRGKVDIELQSERLAGFTHWTQNKDQGLHEIAISVDVPGFFEHYFGQFHDGNTGLMIEKQLVTESGCRL